MCDVWHMRMTSTVYTVPTSCTLSPSGDGEEFKIKKSSASRKLMKLKARDKRERSNSRNQSIN